MAVSLSVIAAKDSAGTAIAGGLQAQDKSGAGTGPFTLGQILIDGLAGTNMAAVTAANAVKVDGSAVTQPVSLASVPSHAVTNAGTFATQSAITAASGSVASGAVSSGAFASGSMAAGSHAAGAGVDGWDLTQGAIADAAVTAGATGSVSAKLRSVSRDVGSVATALGTTALDLGPGTGGSRTLRVAIDTAQLDGSEYETVAASQTTQALGATGATGDYLREVLITPATTSPGAVQIKDGSNTAITVFTGGATTVSNLVPFTISLGLTSTSGAWQVTTGSNVSAVGIGNFT
jgi:serine protease Do